MSEYTVGKEIVTYCGPCKLDLSHMIVALAFDGRPAKLQCKTCGATHGLRQSPAAKAAAKRRVGTSKTRKKVSDMTLSEMWTQAVSKAEGETVKYTIRHSFKTGDLIDHGKFGPGVVQEVTNSNIEVLFRDNVRTLVHNK